MQFDIIIISHSSIIVVVADVSIIIIKTSNKWNE